MLKIKSEIYEQARGFVGFFKPQNEPLVLNELHSKATGIKIIKRAKEASYFQIDNFGDLLPSIVNLDLVYPLHIHPVHVRCGSGLADIVKGAAELAALSEDGDILTCQCKIVAEERFDFSPGDIVKGLEKAGLRLNPEKADTVISVTVFDGETCMGISKLEHNLSPWTGGVLFYAKTEDIMCRAEFKLEEAFKVFGVRVNEGMRALDLGAAPGGWTHFLALKGVSVDAVDPAKLSPQVEKLKSIRHFKMTAQEFDDECEDNDYDIIVNDMKMDGSESAQITSLMAKRLSKNGVCILTLKLPKTGAQKKINAAKAILQREFQTVKMRQLYYNRSEVTCFLKRHEK